MPLWTPAHIPEQLETFAAAVAARYGVEATDIAALHQFSIDRSADFWDTV